MKAIIMAGGEGSRLRPLTCEKPKPLMPVLGKPVMRYAVELLHKHGIYDIAATVAYRGNLIKEEFSDSVVFFEERTPLGTAGSIKNAKEFLNAPFIVISGDALTDVDLTDAVAFHKNSGALATLILKRVEDPLEYGV
ncbi:MAG: nucleotidyltransferase family protein, partial [Clostridia bacterium]|nr:nucleotidyltransferase family protein [Clostridia bacterium]